MKPAGRIKRQAATLPDFICTSGPRVFLLEPLTDAASDWLRTHTPEESGTTFAVERRYLRYTLRAVPRAGLTVSVQPQDKAA